MDQVKPGVRHVEMTMDPMLDLWFGFRVIKIWSWAMYRLECFRVRNWAWDMGLGDLGFRPQGGLTLGHGGGVWTPWGPPLGVHRPPGMVPRTSPGGP